jgi:hypothetical protein
MVILGFWINQELDQPAISHGLFDDVIRIPTKTVAMN